MPDGEILTISTELVNSGETFFEKWFWKVVAVCSRFYH
jgi:hypothetical protein